MITVSNAGTPYATRVLLVLALTVTAVTFMATWPGLVAHDGPAAIVPALVIYTSLFILRVAGQLLVALKPQSWLPPMEHWNLVPYAILLPVQIGLIGAMLWVDVSFATQNGIAMAEATAGGRGLVLFSTLYAVSMLFRYAVTMVRRPERRWFGGTIPISFHFVLAAYSYTLGAFLDRG